MPGPRVRQHAAWRWPASVAPRPGGESQPSAPRPGQRPTGARPAPDRRPPNARPAPDQRPTSARPGTGTPRPGQRRGPSDTPLAGRGTIPGVIRLIGIVATIGIADSLNPTTIAPALYLASHHAPRREVARFTLGVFLVYLLGGAVIALGPGQLLLSLLPKPGPRVEHTIEVLVGLAMAAGAAVLWHRRRVLAPWPLPAPRTRGHSSTVLGATIMAVELPTAFPYFGAIAAIVGSGAGAARQMVLLVLFNVCFVLPLLAIVATLWLAGDRAAQILGRWR